MWSLLQQSWFGPIAVWVTPHIGLTTVDEGPPFEQAPPGARSPGEQHLPLTRALGGAQPDAQAPPGARSLGEQHLPLTRTSPIAQPGAQAAATMLQT